MTTREYIEQLNRIQKGVDELNARVTEQRKYIRDSEIRMGESHMELRRLQARLEDARDALHSFVAKNGLEESNSNQCVNGSCSHPQDEQGNCVATQLSEQMAKGYEP